MDREKVIKGLNYCTHTDGTECPNCPYWQDDDCVEALNADVLALLKEQETIECEMCGHRLQTEWNWCPWCRWETAKRSVK